MATALPERRSASIFDLIMLVALTKSAYVCPKTGPPSFLEGIAVHHTRPGTRILNPVSNDGVLLNTTMLSSRVCN